MQTEVTTDSGGLVDCDSIASHAMSSSLLRHPFAVAAERELLEDNLPIEDAAENIEREYSGVHLVWAAPLFLTSITRFFLPLHTNLAIPDAARC